MLTLACWIALAVPQNAGAIAFGQACLDATTDAVVLNLAAHPDDEAARTMVLLRHRHGVRTVTLYSTCGGGGQNAVGREIGRKLAAIRIRETRAAADHTGTELRWLGFQDFGYSKSMAETLAVWGEQRLLDRLSQTLTELQPDLAFTNHSVTRGHGHHRATAWAITRLCAARPDLPLYQRVFRGDAPIAFDPFAVDGIRGSTFARQAHDGWVEHVSQGPWGPHNPLRIRSERWRPLHPPLADGETPPHPLTQLRSVFDLPAFRDLLQQQQVDATALEQELDAFRTDRSRHAHVTAARELLPRLRQLLADLDQAPTAQTRLARRIEALERVVTIGSGVDLQTWLVDRRLAPGGSGRLRATVRGAGVRKLTLHCEGQSVTVDPGPAERSGPAAPQDSGDPALEILRNATSAPAEPALPPGWVELTLRAPEAESGDDPLVDLTATRSFPVIAEFELDGLPLTIRRRLDVAVTAPLELAWSRRVVSVPAGRGRWQRVVSLEVGWHGDEVLTETLRLRHPAGLELEAIPATVRLSPEQPRTRVLVRITGDGGPSSDPVELSARIRDSARASLVLQPMPVTVSPDLKVGLVRGPDDTVHRFFEDLGVPFELLDETALAVADLRHFSTILLDIRAYHHRPDLGNHRERLLRFMSAGGRIVSLYHKPREWNAAAGKPQLAPFPLRIGSQRVSEQDAAVAFLLPQHHLLTKPHAITSADFEGWVQERGLNFPSEWDAAWIPLLSMHDRGEKPLASSLLHTHYGRGDFVYCSLALYRQIRVGHLGAARLLLNLLTPSPDD